MAEASRGASRRMLVSGASGIAFLAALSSGATQFVASRLDYNSWLGKPWFGHFYAPWAWVNWQQQPWAADCTHTFGLMRMGLMTAMAAGFLGTALWQQSRRRRPKGHEGIKGTARYQTEAEMLESGLLTPIGEDSRGVYVGGWTDPKGRVRYLRHDGPEHCIIVAPTRSGKGVGVILPTLLSWLHSAIIYDEKGELWPLTTGWRKQGADNVCIKWAPGEPQGSAGFNPLSEIRLGTPYEVSDAQNIALMVTDPNGEGIEAKDHWGKTSHDLLAAVFLHVSYRERDRGRQASFTDVAFAISDPNEDANTLWEEMRTNTYGPNGTTHRVIAAAGRDQLDRPERERGSVLSTAKTYLALFKDPIIGANTERSDFRLRDLMDGSRPLSLYIVTRGADKERLRPLVRLFLTMALRHLMAADLNYRDGKAAMPHKHRMLMMLDEFPSLGRLQIVQDALPKSAGYGIKFFLAVQNRVDLFRVYSQHQAITSNCHIRVIYSPNEIEDAKWISSLMGTETIIKEDFTESGRRYGSMGQVSRTFHEVERPLMTPDEIMTLKRPRKEGKDEKERIVEPGEMVVFMAGTRPIRGTQILHFTDSCFRERCKIPPPPTDRIRTIHKEFVF